MARTGGGLAKNAIFFYYTATNGNTGMHAMTENNTNMPMHDWTLVDIVFAWQTGIVTVTVLDNNSALITILATQVKELVVPRYKSWGSSGSINQYELIFAKDSTKKLRIEMQSGDSIEIMAENFILPAP